MHHVQCGRCGAPTAPRPGVCAGCELYVDISETLRTADRKADWRRGIQKALRNYKARTTATLDELPLHLDACHSCAMRKVRIDDDGSNFAERYLGKRRRAYHAQHTGRIPPQGRWRYGLNELGGEECSVCGHRASADGYERGAT